MVRTVLAWIVAVLLLMPLPIINAVDSDALRMGILVMFSAILIAALGNFTKAKTAELFASGAT